MDKDKFEKLMNELHRNVEMLTIKLSDDLTLEYEHTFWDQEWMLTFEKNGHGTGVTDATALALIQAANGPKTNISYSSRMMEDDELNERKNPSNKN